MAEHAAPTRAAMGERRYTDYAHALVAGELYWTETRTYHGDDGSVVPVTMTHPPTLVQLNLRMPDLVPALERRWAALAAVNAFGKPTTEWRVAVRTTLVDSTRKEPLTPGSPVMVNRPYKALQVTTGVVRKGEAEAAGLYWADAADYGLTPRELAEYETVSARIVQIRTHCSGGITRDERRELQYLDLLTLHAHNIRARIVRKHMAWLRRRHAVAAMARLTAPPAPAPSPAGRIGEW